MYCLTDDCTLILCSTCNGKITDEMSLPILKVEPIFEKGNTEITSSFKRLFSRHFKDSLKTALKFRTSVDGCISPFIGTYDDLVWFLSRCLESVDCLMQPNLINSARITFTSVLSDRKVEVLLV